MPYLAPALAPLVGGGAAAQMAVGLGLSLAAGYGARALSPKPSNQAAAGQRLSTSYDPNRPREIVVGLAAVAGSHVHRNVYGAQEYVETVLDLSDFVESDGLHAVIVDGKPVTWNPVTGLVAEFPNMQIRFKSGSWDQTADADLVAHSADGRWTVNHRGRGVTHTIVQLRYNAKEYPNGEPRILFVLRGAKFYDWRKDSTAGGSGPQRWGQPATYAHTRNPWVIGYNWLRGIWLNGQRVAGMNCPAGMLPLSDWTAAANACDEIVTKKDGTTEARYTADGVFSTASPHREILRALITSCAGKLVDTGGVLRPLTGVASPAVLAITDDDLMASGDIEIIEKKSRADLVNAVFGSCHDPAQQYEATALPPRISPADEATDGARLERHYALDLVTSTTQGQRVLEILRRKGRYQATAKVSLCARCSGLEAGDVISWTSARYGWVNRLFEVTTGAVNDAHTEIAVTLEETAAAIYAWTAGTDELDPLAPMTVPAGGTPAVSIAGLVVTNAAVASDGGGQRPALFLTWTPPADPSIVAIDVLYRRVGDTVGLPYRILDPAAGSTYILDGVQGVTAYEVALLPVTVPERNGLAWTAWTAPAGVSVTHEVDVALVAEDVTPGIIDADDLDEQSRFLLQLAALSEEANYGVAHAVAELRNEVQTLGEAVLSNRIESNGTTANARTAIRLHQTLSESYASYVIQTDAALEGKASAASMLLLENRVTDVEGEIEAQAAALLAAEAEIDGKASASSVLGLTSRVEETEEGLYYAEQAAYLSITENGIVKGLAGLYGSEWLSYFIVGADKLIVAHPTYGYDSGHIAPFVVGTNQYGAGYVSVNGNIIANGTIYAEALNVATLSAITANLGTVTAGIIRNPENTLIFDLANMRLYRTDGKADIDLKNLRFRFGSD